MRVLSELECACFIGTRLRVFYQDYSVSVLLGPEYELLSGLECECFIGTRL